MRAATPMSDRPGDGSQGGAAANLRSQGVARMEQGDWNGAVEAFRAACASSARGPDAQYLAAVTLLKEASVSGKAQGARLARFAAALKLEDKHRLALLQSSVTRNMEVGNFG
jgi:hypothetical protein